MKRKALPICSGAEGGGGIRVRKMNSDTDTHNDNSKNYKAIPTLYDADFRLMLRPFAVKVDFTRSENTCRGEGQVVLAPFV